MDGPKAGGGLSDYTDAVLAMRLPAYMKQQRGIRYFKGPRKAPIYAIGVDLPSKENAERMKTEMLAAEARETEWMGVELRIIRRGQADGFTDSAEVLGSSHNRTNGEDLHDYGIVFWVSGQFVLLTVAGRGPLDEFDASARAIAASIRLVDQKGVPSSK